jgi:hypothetical protein
MSRKLKRRVRAKRRTKSAMGSGVKEQNARAQPHPLIGALRGTVTIAPGTDLTQPADLNGVSSPTAMAATIRNSVAALIS